jgi:hypothetical protein
MMVGVVIVLIVWVGVMIGLSHYQSARIPPLLHYPGTESVKEQLVPNLGWRKYWFKLDQDYPSTAAYDFYAKALVPKGWWLANRVAPGWYRKDEKGKVSDVFTATWVSPDRIYQVDLQMASIVHPKREGKRVISETRDPGLLVYVTMRRSMGPWLLEKEGKSPGRGELDMKGPGK